MNRVFLRRVVAVYNLTKSRYERHKVLVQGNKQHPLGPLSHPSFPLIRADSKGKGSELRVARSEIKTRRVHVTT